MHVIPQNGPPHHIQEGCDILKESPLISIMPGFFARIHALQKHIVTALKLLVCPQCTIHGWVGLVMDLVMYALLEPTAPFVSVNNPGNFPVNTNFAT